MDPMDMNDNPEGTVDDPLSVEDGAESLEGLIDDLVEEQDNVDEDDEEEGDEGDPEDDEEELDEEAEEDDDGEADDQDEDEPQGDARFVPANGKVTMPDGSVVTVQELQAGYQRQSDYSRKTDEVATQRREVETLQERIQQQSQLIDRDSQVIQMAIHHIVGEEPDPAHYIDEQGLFNNFQYETEKANRTKWLNFLNQLQQQTTQRQQLTQKQHQDMMAEWAQKERELLFQKAPGLKKKYGDVDAMVSGMADDAGQFYGLSGEDLKAQTDHRALLVLKDAIAYRKLKTAKVPKAKKQVEGKPPVQRGSKRRNPKVAEIEARKARAQRLRSTGSLEDGAEALMHLIE